MTSVSPLPSTVVVTDGNPIDAHLNALMRDGYLILPSLLDPRLCRRFYEETDPVFRAAPFASGAFYGETTKRFGRVLIRSAAARAVVVEPTVLAIVRRLLGVDPQLNLSQAIEIHPGAPVQPPHRDHDMWAFPKQAELTYMVNVMWTLDAFDEDNGATRLWPESHLGYDNGMLPSEHHAVSACAPPGSAIIFLGQTLHSGGANRSNKPRRGVIFSYCRDWLLPDENPWLAYPPTVACSFSAELAALVGYRQRYAGLNNFEGRDPSILLGGGNSDLPGFVDAMSPEQLAIIRAYYERLHRDAADGTEDG